MNKTQEALKMAIEALEEAQDMIGDGGSSIPDYFKKQINACKEALAYMQEHDNEVIEKCAKVCDGYTHGAMVCANAIRALIEKE